MEPALSGALIGLGGIIVTAVLGFAGVIVARKLRAPVSVPEMWDRISKMGAEIEALQGQVKKLIAERETSIAVVRLVGEGFDIYDARHGDSLEEAQWTERERESISRARQLRRDDDLWQTLGGTKIA